MADIPFSYEDFEQTRKQLVKVIHSKLTEEDRLFLMSFKEGLPDWGLLSVKNAKELPALRWKLQNIEALRKKNSEKHDEMLKTLEGKLYP
jgi:hypothetical protein